MKILAIDTSSIACSVALLIDGDIQAIDKILPLQQAQSILSSVNELLLGHNIVLKQLDALAFGCGPGSFTGLRIAASVIQGFGYALNLPVIPVSSLASVAQAAYLDLGWKKFLVGMDARIQEVYWGAYVVDASGLVTLQDREVIAKPSELIFPEGDDWCGVGDAWSVYRSDIHFQPLHLDATRLPNASAILHLARAKYLQREWVSASEAIPIYLRDNVAKIAK